MECTEEADVGGALFRWAAWSGVTLMRSIHGSTVHIKRMMEASVAPELPLHANHTAIRVGARVGPAVHGWIQENGTSGRS